MGMSPEEVFCDRLNVNTESSKTFLSSCDDVRELSPSPSAALIKKGTPDGVPFSLVFSVNYSAVASSAAGVFVSTKVISSTR
ncbi:hypothetical protein PEPS_03830 [Persicobacter psychrovividus]|uniref:Uncharacterized protein n=1 Tax=Persicobacter psychrovividus TaxID=387638 RepID=A0ABM7VB04_9BACT|nr:hypothetical protein PEPS_03830 [Persicobacter psychrovividus]